jgi:hypothetical protein
MDGGGGASFPIDKRKESAKKNFLLEISLCLLHLCRVPASLSHFSIFSFLLFHLIFAYSKFMQMSFQAIWNDKQ